MEIDDMKMLTGNNENKGLTAEQKASLHALLQSYENVVLAADNYCNLHECNFCPMRCGRKKCPMTEAKRLAKYLERVAGGIE